MRNSKFKLDGRARGIGADDWDVDQRDAFWDDASCLDVGDELARDEVGQIGYLGAASDGPHGIDELVRELERESPGLFDRVASRAARTANAAKDFRSGPARPWPSQRAPEEHWRALADEAFGDPLHGDSDAAEALSRAATLGEVEEAQILQRFTDWTQGLGIFQKAFDREREEWGRAYWMAAVDESFGKREWRGPAGWRSPR